LVEIAPHTLREGVLGNMLEVIATVDDNKFYQLENEEV
jgi:hypothetical protein